MTVTSTRPARWTARAGAWLAIGSSPAGLVLGAGIAERHDGPAPLLAMLAGGLVMVALLTAQGTLGLAAPAGEDATLSELSPRYLRHRSQLFLNGCLGLAMIGWFGFNVGLGGAAAAALLDVPGPVGPLLLGVPILLFSFGGMRRWNPLAVVTTCSALILVAVVTIRLAAPASPVTLGAAGGQAAMADVAAFVGYVAVFSLRAPDFSVGLAGRRDLAWCVSLLVVPTLLTVAAGIALHQGTGSTDLVGTLAGPGGLALGNLLVALAVVAPAFTTTYSGSLALRAVTRLPERPAMLVVAVPGLVLATARFDRHILPWLVLLAAMLPALVVPMAAEGARRRRGRRAQLVPLWTFAPASLGALGLAAAGQPVAPLVGLLVAGAATALWLTRSGTARPHTEAS